MRGKILYMEDDTFFADLLSRKLRGAGYEIDVAPDGEAGMQKVRSGYDLILLDILMPKMDGFEVLRQLKADDALSTVPVIVLSNLGAEEDLNRAKELGAEIFLVKAATIPSQILDSIDQVLIAK